MSNPVFNVVAEGELQFYRAINDYKIGKFGEPEYGENAMNIFRSKIIHSLGTLEALKPRKPSEFLEKELEKIINDRKAIMSRNGFPKSYLPCFSMTDVQKTQKSLALAELEYYQHFLNNGASGLGFSSCLEKTEYGKLIKHGFESRDSFIDANIKIRDSQIADNTAFIRQLAKAGKIKQSESEKDIEKHSGLYNLIFELKKRFVESRRSRAEETIEHYLKNEDIFGLIQYLDENILPRY